MPFLHLHKHRRFLGDLAILLNMRVLAMGLAFATSVILARLLGPGEFGKYAFAIALYMIIEPIAGGGLSTLATREMADPVSDSGAKERQVTNLLLTALLLSLSVCITVLGGMGLLGVVQPSVAILSLLIVPGAIAFQVASGSLIGQHKIKLGQFLSRLGKPLIFIAAVILLNLYVRSEVSAIDVLLCMALSSWLALLFALYVSPISPRLCYISWPRLDNVVALLKLSLPFAVITALQYLQTRIDVLSINALLHDADVGYYQVASRIAQLVSVPSSLLAIMMNPRFSRMFKVGDAVGLRVAFWKSFVLSVGFSLGAFLTLWLLSTPLLLTLYGESYRPALSPLVVLLVAQCLFSAVAVPTALMTMTGHQAGLVKTVSVTAVMNVIGNLTLVPIYGIDGAAISTAIVGVFTLVWLLGNTYSSGILKG